MSKLPQLSGAKLVKALKRDGWTEVGQRGSHLKLVKYLQPGRKIVIVPQHKVLKKGTLGRILKDASISVEKLKELL